MQPSSICGSSSGEDNEDDGVGILRRHSIARVMSKKAAWSWGRMAEAFLVLFNGLALTLVCTFALAYVVTDLNKELEKEVESHKLKEVGFGMVCLIFASVLGVVALGRKVAYGFLEDHSQSVPCKEAVRSTLSNLAIVGALIFTVTGAAIITDKPAKLGRNEEVGMEWYQALALAAFAWSLLATIIPTLGLIFTDGLSDGALELMIKAFPDAFGSPVLMNMSSMFFLGTAVSVRANVIYGTTAMLVTVMLSLGCCLAITYVYWRLYRWENGLDATMKYNLEDWEAGDVANFLEKEGFKEQGRLFAEHRIGGDVLCNMTEVMLLDLVKELDVRPYGARYKLTSTLTDLIAGKKRI